MPVSIGLMDLINQNREKTVNYTTPEVKEDYSNMKVIVRPDEIDDIDEDPQIMNLYSTDESDTEEYSFDIDSTLAKLPDARLSIDSLKKNTIDQVIKDSETIIKNIYENIENNNRFTYTHSFEMNPDADTKYIRFLLKLIKEYFNKLNYGVDYCIPNTNIDKSDRNVTLTLDWSVSIK